MKKFVKAVIFGALAASVYIGMMSFISLPLQIVMKTGTVVGIKKDGGKEKDGFNDFVKSVARELGGDAEKLLNDFSEGLENSDVNVIIESVKEKIEGAKTEESLDEALEEAREIISATKTPLRLHSIFAYYILLSVQFILSLAATFAFVIFFKKVILLFPDIGKYFSGLYVVVFAAILILPHLLSFLSLFMRFPIFIANIFLVAAGAALGTFVTVTAARILPDVESSERGLELLGEEK